MAHYVIESGQGYLTNRVRPNHRNSMWSRDINDAWVWNSDDYDLADFLTQAAEDCENEIGPHCVGIRVQLQVVNPDVGLVART